MSSKIEVRERMANCRHYNGMKTYNCEVGVNMLDFNNGSNFGIANVIPCFGPKGLNGPVAATCPKYSPRTEQEILDEDAEFDGLLKRGLKAREAVLAVTLGKKGERGEMKCPCCQDGKLSFGNSAYNGHLQMKCSTDGCVSWQEYRQKSMTHQ